VLRFADARTSDSSLIVAWPISSLPVARQRVESDQYQ
jgi:hypothetical protein